MWVFYMEYFISCVCCKLDKIFNSFLLQLLRKLGTVF